MNEIAKIDKLREWKVFKDEIEHFANGETTTYRVYDTVFFDQKITAPEVYKSLIENDGYPSDIILRWTHNDENGYDVSCEYPSDYYEINDEYDKQIMVIDVFPWD